MTRTITDHEDALIADLTRAEADLKRAEATIEDIKRICRNWKTILGRKYFTQRGAADFAETPAIDIRADGFENANGLLT